MKGSGRQGKESMSTRNRASVVIFNGRNDMEIAGAVGRYEASGKQTVIKLKPLNLADEVGDFPFGLKRDQAFKVTRTKQVPTPALRRAISRLFKGSPVKIS